MDSSQLYESLMAQATHGGWIKGFELRPKDVDPWGLGIFDPNVVLFEKPPERREEVEQLREVIFTLGRSLFIEQSSW